MIEEYRARRQARLDAKDAERKAVIDKFKQRRKLRLDENPVEIQQRIDDNDWNLDGGKGSGNFGHAGRIGKVGGSLPQGQNSGEEGETIGSARKIVRPDGKIIYYPSKFSTVKKNLKDYLSDKRDFARYALTIGERGLGNGPETMEIVREDDHWINGSSGEVISDDFRELEWFWDRASGAFKSDAEDRWITRHGFSPKPEDWENERELIMPVKVWKLCDGEDVGGGKKETETETPLAIEPITFEEVKSKVDEIKNRIELKGEVTIEDCEEAGECAYRYLYSGKENEIESYQKQLKKSEELTKDINEMSVGLLEYRERAQVYKDFATYGSWKIYDKSAEGIEKYRVASVAQYKESMPKYLMEEAAKLDPPNYYDNMMNWWLREHKQELTEKLKDKFGEEEFSRVFDNYDGYEELEMRNMLMFVVDMEKEYKGKTNIEYVEEIFEGKTPVRPRENFGAKLYKTTAGEWLENEAKKRAEKELKKYPRYKELQSKLKERETLLKEKIYEKYNSETKITDEERAKIRELVHRTRGETEGGMEGYIDKMGSNFRESDKAYKDIVKMADDFPKFWIGEFVEEAHQKIVKQGGRACYSEYFGRIQVSGNAGDATVHHEFGHFMEHKHPEILKMSKEFVKRRAEHEDFEQLYKIYKGYGYGRDEKTKVDSFLHAYMGKYYRDATEVLSMGLQYAFSYPKYLAIDRKYANYIYGLLMLAG